MVSSSVLDIIRWSLCISLLTVEMMAAQSMDEGNKAILLDFQSKVQNGDEMLQWKSSDTDPCSSWNGIKCTGAFVSSINLANQGLMGSLTSELNQLSSLTTIALQSNGFTGPLPSLNGLKNLQSCYLDNNDFDTIPADFFDNLPNLLFLSLNGNSRLNSSTNGWVLPTSLETSVLLTNLSLTNTSLRGTIPPFLGNLGALNTLRLAYNKLGGSIPTSFSSSNLQVFQANNQLGPFLSGSLEPSVGNMKSLRQLWLHQNQISGILPPDLSTNSISLTDLRLNGNQLVGPIPESYTKLPLVVFAVENNRLDGPIPNFGQTMFTFENNLFCRNEIGVPCAPQVDILLDFLASIEYPSGLVASWSDNDPCEGSWVGIDCDSSGNVVVLSLSNANLSGFISPRIGELSSLTTLKLNNNKLSGTIPSTLANLTSLKVIDVSYNNLTGPIPVFSSNLDLDTTGNPFINVNTTSSLSDIAPGSTGTSGNSVGVVSKRRPPNVVLIVVTSLIVSISAILTILFFVRYRKHRYSEFKKSKKNSFTVLNSVAKPDPPPDQSIVTVGLEKGGLGFALSFRTVQMATDNFSPENFLGKGGFGSVYKGYLEDGTIIAVKRMEASVMSQQGLKEFESELNLLSKLRHRHLVSILGYCVEGDEKVLVYEYMCGGPLSQHLFEFSRYGMEPLSWRNRLSVALDVARGLEYLHGLAQNSFIHRDLKPSNILLDANVRAKISDFGFVRLVPEGERQSIQTMVAGTFGYLAPEYALTGHITTKGDVFSFGVVLMELITGRRALDDRFLEGRFQLVPWFRRAICKTDKLLEAIDPIIVTMMVENDNMKQSLYIVAELAGHCTNREASARPDMSHVVNILAPLVQVWKPCDDNLNDASEAEMTAEEVRRKLLSWEYDSTTSMTSLNGTSNHVGY